jgi:uncharacterized protein with PIN domain
MDYQITFHGELSFFLKDRKEGTAKYSMKRTAPLKDIIEALGIPHTEVGKIVTYEREHDFWYIPSPDDNIEVYPVEAPCIVTIPTLLRPEAFPWVKFIADVNVGKLAKLMRLLGFDTEYENSWSDSYIAEKAFREKRIVLTKDRNLLKRKVIRHGRLVRSIKPWDQLAEIVHFYGLGKSISPFRICPICNVELENVPKEHILEEIEPLTRLFFNDFSRCPCCGKVYWAGTHHEKILQRVTELKDHVGTLKFSERNTN